jgi:GNAT superfamily N-acetyltransferase
VLASDFAVTGFPFKVNAVIWSSWCRGILRRSGSIINPVREPAAAQQSRFRIAKTGDVDAIVAMMRGYYAQDGYTFVGKEARAAALMLIRDPHLGRLWVACDGKRVVGYLAVALGFSFEYRGREAFVDELLIAESHRGRGLGREALDIAEAYCRNMGVNALHLEVEGHRENALQLYRRRGFKDFDRYLMTKWLGKSRRPRFR